MPSSRTLVSPPVLDEDLAMRTAMLLLLGGYECAGILHRPVSEMALTVQELCLRSGAIPEHLTRMLEEGYLELAQAGDGTSTVTVQDPSTLVTQTLAGTAKTRQILGRARAEPVKPSWDGRFFRLRQLVLKEFRRYPTDQGPLLDALETADWPRRLDNPLEPRGRRDSAKRLRDTVRQLNSGQQPWLIRFSTESQGKGVRWMIRPPSV